MEPPLPLGLAELPVNPAIRHLVIGVFDGVHRGHAAVIRSALAETPAPDELGLLTFDPHPLQIIAPGRAPGLLTSLSERCERIRELGLRSITVLRFDPELRQLTAREFLGQLHDRFPSLTAISVGQNFHFGKDRSGNGAFLETAGPALGFQAHIVPPVELDGETVSSSRIRQAVAGGDFLLAAQMLGRPWSLDGRVVRGDGRGKELGFPTANLDPSTRLLPPAGVYACRSCIDGTLYPAVLNLGSRPTFGGSGPIIPEVHLVGFTGDLYGMDLKIFDFRFLRNEKKFAGAAELKKQLAADIARAFSG